MVNLHLKSAFTLLLAVIALSSGCAAPDQPRTVFGGYTDQKVDETIFYITYSGQRWTSEAQSIEGWNNRAKALCKGDNFESSYRVRYVYNEFGVQVFKTSGWSYCNSLIEDTRLQGSDEDFRLKYPVSISEEDLIGATNNVVQKIRSEDFEGLEKLFDRIDIDFSKGELSEFELLSNYYQLESLGPKDLQYLSRWIEEHQGSSLAYLTRAMYYDRAAWRIRGHGFSNTITDEVKTQFRDLSELSLSDVTKSINLNSAHLYSHILKLSILTNLSSTEQNYTKTYETALKQFPDSLMLRRAHVRKAFPEWGGSIEALKKESEKALTESEQRPSIKAIAGVPHWHRGKRVARTGDHELAVAFFNQALLFGEMTDFYLSRAYSYTKVENYEAALNDYSRALSINPQSELAYRGLAEVFESQEDYSSAIQAYTMAIHNHDYVASLFRKRGDLLYFLRFYELAYKDYKKASDLSNLPLDIHNVKKALFQASVRGYFPNKQSNEEFNL